MLAKVAKGTKPERGTNLANTELFNAQAVVEKLIAKVQFIMPVDQNQDEQDVAAVLSKTDLQGAKFLKLAARLKNNTLSDDDRRNVIMLTKAKLSLSKMVELHCLAIAEKCYLQEFNKFKHSDRSAVSAEVLRRNGIKDPAKLKWKRYVKLAFGISYSSCKRAIEVF